MSNKFALSSTSPQAENSGGSGWAFPSRGRVDLERTLLCIRQRYRRLFQVSAAQLGGLLGPTPWAGSRGRLNEWGGEWPERCWWCGGGRRRGRWGLIAANARLLGGGDGGDFAGRTGWVLGGLPVEAAAAPVDGAAVGALLTMADLAAALCGGQPARAAAAVLSSRHALVTIDTTGKASGGGGGAGGDGAGEGPFTDAFGSWAAAPVGWHMAAAASLWGGGHVAARRGGGRGGAIGSVGGCHGLPPAYTHVRCPDVVRPTAAPRCLRPSLGCADVPFTPFLLPLLRCWSLVAGALQTARRRGSPAVGGCAAACPLRGGPSSGDATGAGGAAQDSPRQPVPRSPPPPRRRWRR